MNVRELRIGNLVSKNTAQGGWWIDSDVMASDFGKTAAGTLLCESFEPIPITEGWLVKLGFNKYDDLFILTCKNDIDIYYNINPENSISIGNGDYHGTFSMKHIKSIHELQNLYFSLTGEELEIEQL